MLQMRVRLDRNVRLQSRRCSLACAASTWPSVRHSWIVRNSWASTWGEDGYVYLEMKKNTCGLADDVTIPEVSLEVRRIIPNTPRELGALASGVGFR